MSASPKDDPLHRGGDDDYDYEDDVVPFDAPVDELADTAASLDLTSVKMFLESVSHNATLPPARTDDFNATMQSEREMPSHPLEALVVGEGSPNPVRDHSHLRPAAAVGRSRSHTKEQPTNSTPSHEPSPGFTAEGDWDVVPFDLDAAAAQADETVTGTNLGDGFLQGLFAKRASVALHNGILHGSHRPSFLEVDNENTLVKQPSVLQGAGSFARFFRRFSSTQHESARRGSSSRASDVRTSSRAASSAADDDEDRDKEDEEGGEDYQDLMIQARLNGIIMGEWRSRLAISGPADLLLEYMCDAAATVERQQIEERRVLETSMRSTLTRSSGYQLHQVEIAESSARLRQWQQQSRDWVAVLCEPWRRELLEGAGLKGFALIARLALTESEDIARKRIVKSHTKAVHHFVKVREFLLELRTSSINQLSQLHVKEGAGRQAIVSQRQLQNSTYALLNAAYRQHIAIRAAEESERVLLLLNTLVLKETMRRSAIKKQRAEGLADLQDEERTSWRSTVTRLGERQLRAALLQLEDVGEPQARGVLESDQQAARIKLLKLYKTKKPKPLRLDVLLERSETQARAAIAVEWDEALRDIAQDYHLYTPYLLQLETARQALTTTDEPQSRAAIAKSDKEERRYLFTLFQLEDRQQARREKIAASATNEFTTRIVAWRDQALWFDSQPPTVKVRIREMATGMEKNEATQRKYIVNTEAAARDAIVVPFMEVHRSNFTTPQRRKSTLQRRSSTTPGQSNVTTPSALVSGPSPPPGSPTRPLTRQTPSTLRSKWERVLKDLDAVDEQPFEQSDDNVAPALAELLHQRDDARRVSRDARRQSGASARASSFTIGRPSDRRASAVVESAIGPSPGSVHRPQPPMGQSPGVSPRIIAKPDASPKLASRTGSFSLASTQRPSVRNTGLPPQSPKTSAPNPSAFRRDSTSIRA